MSLRLVLAGLALGMAGWGAAALALDATVAPMGAVLKAGKDGTAVIHVKRRSRNVETRPTAPEKTDALPGKPNNGEVLFGSQDVGFLVDRDVIRVGPEIGKFDRIRLRVLKNDINITELKAVYDNGDSETLLKDAKIASDRKTDWIPLKNKGGFIKEIQLVYRSKPDSKGQARVEVFGEYAPGWLGPDGEGRKYNNGWVLLGTDTAGSVGFDQVKIPVGDNQGFKQIRVSVKDRDITMTKLAVVYADGNKEDVENDRIKVAADEAFGPTDLKKDAAIKEIQATWRSRVLATSKRDKAYATVEVWGHH